MEYILVQYVVFNVGSIWSLQLPYSPLGGAVNAVALSLFYVNQICNFVKHLYWNAEYISEHHCLFFEDFFYTLFETINPIWWNCKILISHETKFRLLYIFPDIFIFFGLD